MRVTGIKGSRAEKVARFSAVVEQPAVLDEIHRVVESLWSCRVSGETSLHVLKVHLHRCTFDVIVETSVGTRSVIAKVHDADRSDLFAVMESIVQAGFGPTAEFAISRPLAYLPGVHLLLEEKVPGPQAKTFFVDGDRASQGAAAERCGKWLARFHRDAPRLRGVETVDVMVEQIRRWAQEFQGAGAGLAETAATLRRTLEDSVPGPDGPEPCAGHGSFMPEHVILNGDRTVGIDFDDYLVADPAHDVAWFVQYLTAHGHKHRGSLEAHGHAIDTFLQAYAGSGPRNGLQHLPFYRAVECLHWAYLDLSDGMLDWARVMLDEGLRVLT